MIFLVAADLAIPRMLQTSIDQGIAARDPAVVLRSALAMVGLIAVSALGTVGITVYSVRVSQNLAADIRRELFARVLTFSPGNLDRWPTGALMTRLSSDVAQVAQFTFMTMRMFIRAPLMITGSLVLMVLTNWRLALIMAVLMPATLAVVMLYANRAQPLFVQVQRRLDRLNTLFQENLAGVRVVKAFVRSAYENTRFDAANTELMTRSIRVGRYLSILLPLLRYLVNLGIVAVVGISGLMAARGTVTIGQIVAFNSYLLWVMMALTNLGMMVSFISASDASAQRIFEALDELPAVQDAADAAPLPAGEGRVAFDGVTFGYDGADQEPVLREITLAAEPGQTIALLGATGSGKSSLVNLLPRFYEAQAGRVAYDGVDVRRATLDSLRGQIGLGPQETILFSGTIGDNIRYGRPEASDEEVAAAAQAAQAHDFVMGFADGYETRIGQRGVNLSGGQKQRLAIARALLAEPRVLILDDSTAPWTWRPEARIQRHWTLQGGADGVPVAQRFSSVLGADQIVVCWSAGASWPGAPTTNCWPVAPSTARSMARNWGRRGGGPCLSKRETAGPQAARRPAAGQAAATRRGDAGAGHARRGVWKSPATRARCCGG
jgi:ATP-binding cassette subfamily B protein